MTETQRTPKPKCLCSANVGSLSHTHTQTSILKAQTRTSTKLNNNNHSNEWHATKLAAQIKCNDRWKKKEVPVQANTNTRWHTVAAAAAFIIRTLCASFWHHIRIHKDPCSVCAACVWICFNKIVYFSVDHPCHTESGRVWLYYMRRLCSMAQTLLPRFFFVLSLSSHGSFVCLFAFFIRSTIIFATLFTAQQQFHIVLASFVPYCYYCMPLVTSNKNKIKWVAGATKKITTTMATTTTRQGHCMIIWYISFVCKHVSTINN